MSYTELAELMETVDFAKLADAFFGRALGAVGAVGADGNECEDWLEGLEEANGADAAEYDASALVDAAWSAFELALGDFVERTCEQTHNTVELAVALLTRLDRERAAEARERTDLVNAIKNASVILCGPMIDR
jgi:hypothetical protein